MKTIAIHQPNYIPWIGYFHKMANCDIFVFLDDAQYTKGGFINRNRIKTSQGVKWLSIPAHTSLGFTIKDTACGGDKWPEKHLKTLMAAYGRAPFFIEIFHWFSEILLSNKKKYLAELNISILRSISEKMGIKCSFYTSSELSANGTSDDRLIAIVKALDGNTYLSGHGGSNYQDVAKFKKRGIAIKYSDFAPLEYNQLWGEFIPGLSIIDALFNEGFQGAQGLI